MTTVAIVQARMGSTRLPGKVMRLLDGHPVLEWVVRACGQAPGIDSVWVATSTLPGDDVIEEFCLNNRIPVWRGSETDVLSRFVGCANASGADVILRITGDEPFVDPQVIGAVARLQKQTKADYVSNVSPRTYPDGLDVQAMSRRALFAADAEATRPIDRDCVCTFIERNRSRFPAEAVINPIPGMEKERWVLDTQEDWEFCEAIVRYWRWISGPPSMLDMVAMLERYPALRHLNAMHQANERFFDALAEEPIYERNYSRSQEALKRAQEAIPLGAQTFSKSYLQYPQPSPLFLSHGQGGLVWDIDGNEYVDLVSALLPNILGYRDSDVDNAIRRQLSNGISFSLATQLESELAETLIRLIPCAEAVRFGKTGTDVTTAAVRLARAYTGREKVLVCGGYHGWADWSTQRDLGVPEEVKRNTIRISYGNKSAASNCFDQRVSMHYDSLRGMSWAAVSEIENIAKKKWIAAIIVEPESDPDFLKHLRWLCDHYGALLIFDEVITGFRFALGGAQALWGVTPDLATFGKSMANGMPISALVGKKKIMAKLAPPDNIFYSGTFFGETLSIAAAIATIKKLERDNIISDLWATGEYLHSDVDVLMAKHGISDHEIRLRGAGSFKRIHFQNDDIAALFRREMIKTGTLVIASHNVSAAHGPGEIKRILKSYDHTLGFIRAVLDEGSIKERLAGATVGPMVRK